MKYAYFDTTIFNHLSSKNIKNLGGLINNINELEDLLKKKNVQVVSSAQVLGELAVTSLTDQDYAKELCSIYRKLCGNRIIESLPNILRKEYENIYHKSVLKTDIFINKSNRMFGIINEFASGSFLNQNSQKWINEEKGRKINYKNIIKNQLARVSQNARNEINSASSFEFFYLEYMKSDTIRQRIGAIILAHKIESESRKDQAINRIIQKLDSLSHWEITLRSDVVLTWDYIKNSAVVDRGDGFDVSDAIHLTFLKDDDCLVSDDSGHRRRCGLLKPHLSIFDLKEFIGYLKQLTLHD